MAARPVRVLTETFFDDEADGTMDEAATTDEATTTDD